MILGINTENKGGRSTEIPVGVYINIEDNRMVKSIDTQTLVGSVESQSLFDIWQMCKILCGSFNVTVLRLVTNCKFSM